MMEHEDDSASGELSTESQARRDFLVKAGKFAAVTPPAITLLLGTSLSSRAIAGSGGNWKPDRPGWGFGDKNHFHNGPWNNSFKSRPKRRLLKSKSSPKRGILGRLFS